MEDVVSIEGSGQGDGPGAQSEPSGDASTAAGPPPPASALEVNPLNLAVSVTRQVEISGPRNWKHLVTGIDSLDLGYYVDWREVWAVLGPALAKGRESAQGTQGVRFELREVNGCLILPGGKAPMYRYHLQTPDLHVFIAHRENTSEEYPNVYVSLSAKSIWLKGGLGAVGAASSFVAKLGGSTVRIQISRVDVCADFLIPGGLSLDFISACRVCRSPQHRHFMNGDKLESYYFGSGGAPIQVRIYDKSLEVLSEGVKLWFLDIWKLEECRDVWRFEGQVRRKALKELGIETLPDLAQRGHGLWKYLTEDWLSLRDPGNENVSRRPVHLWWSAMQEMGGNLGPVCELSRNAGMGGQALSEWYVAHGGGCLAGFAAREGFADFETALRFYVTKIRTYWVKRGFEERYRIERIKLGFDDDQEAGAA